MMTGGVPDPVGTLMGVVDRSPSASYSTCQFVPVSVTGPAPLRPTLPVLRSANAGAVPPESAN